MYSLYQRFDWYSKLYHFIKCRGTLFFAIRRIMFKRFYEIFISLTLVVWFEFKVAFLNRYNCIHLIANTLVIVPNLFKTVFALIIASFKTDYAKRNKLFYFLFDFLLCLEKFFLNIIQFTMFIIISKKRLAVRNKSN